MSQDGKVLGTFCMYYREVRHPGTDDIQLIDYASRIAGIAIERERSRSALTMDFEQSSMQYLSSSSLLGPTENFYTAIRQYRSTPA
jgi:hypothetical protein